MNQRIGGVTLVVRDYDEAINWYTTVLGFTLLEDTRLGADKRWVRVAPPGSGGPALLLARAAACSCSSTPTTSSGTTEIFRRAVSASKRSRGWRPTAAWPYSRTCMGTGGTWWSAAEPQGAAGPGPRRRFMWSRRRPMV